MSPPNSSKVAVNGGHFVLASNGPGISPIPLNVHPSGSVMLCRSLCTVTEPVSLSLSGPPQSGPPGQRGVVVVVVVAVVVVAVVVGMSFPR